MGTLEALYWMMKGGVVPGGKLRNCTWLMAVTWATALPMLTCGWKKILMSADAVERLRLDVLDVVDRGGHAAFAVEDDAVGHLLRGEAGEVPHHGNDGDVDIRKDIRRHRLDAEDAEDQNQERKDGKGVRPPQRKPDNPHHKAGTRS